MHLSISTTNKNAYVTSLHHNQTNTDSSLLLPVYTPVFTCEIDQADFLHKKTEQDYYLLTPTGLIVRRIWMTGALTSYESLRQGNVIRIADPTGVLSLSIKPQALENIDPSDLVPPLFLAITAIVEKASGQDGKKVRWVIETCRVATRQDRDNWIIAATDSLLARLHDMNLLLVTGKGEEPLLQAQSHYHIQQNHLKILAEHSNKALKVIKEPGPPIEPSELIISIIREYAGPRGLHMDDIYKYTRRATLADDVVRDTIRNLVAEDEVYQPSPGYVKLL